MRTRFFVIVSCLSALACCWALAAAQADDPSSGRRWRETEQNVKSLAAEAEAAFAAKRFHDAILLASRVLAVVPDRTDLLVLRARAFSMTDQDAKSLSDYKKVLVMESGNTRAMGELAALMEFMPGHEKEALELYRRAALTEQDLKEKERLDFCVAVMENRLLEESSSAAGCWNLGNHLKSQGKIDSAEKHYTKAIELDSDFFQAHYSRALVRINRGDLQGAVEDLNTAVALAPSTRGVLVTRGLLHESVGRFRRARADFQRAARIDARDPETHFHLARLYEKDEAYRQALESYTEALRWKPKSELRELIRSRITVVAPRVKHGSEPSPQIIISEDLW